MFMCRVLTEPRSSVAPDAPHFEAAVEAERDLQVLAFVFDCAAKCPADTEFCRLVKNALKDSLLPSEDRGQSKGRDAQFELFVAAVCQNAELHPVKREEPDVTCHVKGIKFGIAAKRIKNIANLEQHVRKAAAQIGKSRLPGVIAIDTNVALNRDNQRITSPIPDEQFSTMYRRALSQFIDHFHDRIQDWVRGKGVRGIVIHDQQVRFQPDGEWSLVGMTTRVNTSRHNQRRNREFALFEEHYSQGLPNVTEL
ncbi:MAG: hypothetical protein ACYC0X_31440 [Pirellulaceae bacterium]